MSKLFAGRRGRTGLALLVVTFIAAVACGATGAKGTKQEKSPSSPLNPVTYDPRVSLAPLIKKVSPAVVNIRTTVKVQRRGMFGPNDLFEWFFGPQGRGQRPHRRAPSQERRSVGSGFIIDKNGLVVTNHHVVDGATEIEIQLANEKIYEAELVGSDERTDVALLKLKKAKNLPSVSFGDSDVLSVGDHVVAIGNPFGLDHTVTSGIVSAKGRDIQAGSYDDFIQTDASINPGNSGGPLFNLRGDVVGINTAIAPQGQGIGFAIPSSMAAQIIDSLRHGGKVVRGWLGISLQSLDEDLAKKFGVKGKGAVVILEVTEDSPAEKGGMIRGDVITAFNGKKLTKFRQLPMLVAKVKPGSTVPVKVIRNRKPISLKIKVGQAPDEFDPSAAQSQGQARKTTLGIEVSPLDSRMRRQLGAEKVKGVVVTDLDSDSPAAKKIRAGDIVAEVNHQKTRTIEEFAKHTKNLKAGDDVLLLVFRAGRFSYQVIRLE